jgi:hypothetical protein
MTKADHILEKNAAKLDTASKLYKQLRKQFPKRADLKRLKMLMKDKEFQKYWMALAKRNKVAKA